MIVYVNLLGFRSCHFRPDTLNSDDLRVIMGSANLNDRSQKGDGDSEIALVVEDSDLIDSRMDGQPVSELKMLYMDLHGKISTKPLGSRQLFVAPCSRVIDLFFWKPNGYFTDFVLEHIGLMKPQFCEPENKDVITSYMTPVPHPHKDTTQSPEDQLVADPLSDEFIELWDSTAKRNTQIFGEIFKTVPSNNVRSWKEYTVRNNTVGSFEFLNSPIEIRS